jgi:hypothetical protein
VLAAIAQAIAGREQRAAIEGVRARGRRIAEVIAAVAVVDHAIEEPAAGGRGGEGDGEEQAGESSGHGILQG